MISNCEIVVKMITFGMVFRSSPEFSGSAHFFALNLLTRIVSTEVFQLMFLLLSDKLEGGKVTQAIIVVICTHSNSHLQPSANYTRVATPDT